jgi:hypothetical protein
MGHGSLLADLLQDGFPDGNDRKKSKGKGKDARGGLWRDGIRGYNANVSRSAWCECVEREGDWDETSDVLQDGWWERGSDDGGEGLGEGPGGGGGRG